MKSPGVLALLAALSGPAQALDGRWEGQARLGGREQAVVLDLVGAGATAGAVLTLPGRSVQRQRLAEWQRQPDGRWTGTAPPAPGNHADDALRLTLALMGTGLKGSLSLGGHEAALQLVRTGEAMPLPARPAPVPALLHGHWRGRYDLGFGPREITLRLAAEGSSLELVGRRTVALPLSEAGLRGALLVLRADEADLRLDAPWAEAAGGVLRAQLRQGPFEAAVELQREAAP